MTEKLKRGRQPGPLHPMPMREFWILFLEQLPNGGSVCAAYEKAETITVEVYGRRRFRSYAAFRIAKMRFYRVRKEKRPRD